MRRFRPSAVALSVVAAAGLSSCGSSPTGVKSGSAASSAELAEADPGFLVPTRWINVQDTGAYQVAASLKGETFTVTADGGAERIAFTTARFTPSADSVPVRCGTGGQDDNPDVPFDSTFPGAATVGDTSVYETPGESVPQVSVTSSDAGLQKVNPEAFRTLAPATLSEAAFLDEATVQRLVADPKASLEVERWSHQFADGLGIDAALKGSLFGGLRLMLIASIDGKEIGRDATDLGLVHCNQRTGLQYSLPDRTIHLVFVSDGATAVIDGKPITDLVRDSALMGSWTAVDVAKDAGPVTVTFDETSSGRRLAESTLAYSTYTNDGAGE